MLLAVPDNSPYRTLEDIVAAAQKNPGKLNLGAINHGSTQNLSAHLFEQVTGAKYTIVPYRTTPDLITALLHRDVRAQAGDHRTRQDSHRCDFGKTARSVAQGCDDRQGERFPELRRHQLERRGRARRHAGRDRQSAERRRQPRPRRARAGPPISGWDKASEAAAAADIYPELIAEVERVEADWFHRSGIYPIHGLIVVKDEHTKRHPWLPRSLMNAFVAAKKPYLDELTHGRGDKPEDKRYHKFLSLMNDPLPYGMTTNRPSVEALVTYSLQQGLIPSRPKLDQVFVEIDP